MKTMVRGKRGERWKRKRNGTGDKDDGERKKRRKKEEEEEGYGR